MIFDVLMFVLQRPMCSCDMALVGDYDFYTGPHAQEDKFEAIQHMVNVVVEADQIFRETDFDGVHGKCARRAQLTRALERARIRRVARGGAPRVGTQAGA